MIMTQLNLEKSIKLLAAGDPRPYRILAKDIYSKAIESVKDNVIGADQLWPEMEQVIINEFKKSGVKYLEINWPDNLKYILFNNGGAQDSDGDESHEFITVSSLIIFCIYSDSEAKDETPFDEDGKPNPNYLEPAIKCVEIKNLLNRCRSYQDHLAKNIDSDTQDLINEYIASNAHISQVNSWEPFDFSKISRKNNFESKLICAKVEKYLAVSKLIFTLSQNLPVQTVLTNFHKELANQKKIISQPIFKAQSQNSEINYESDKLTDLKFVAFAFNCVKSALIKTGLLKVKGAEFVEKLSNDSTPKSRL